MTPDWAPLRTQRGGEAKLQLSQNLQPNVNTESLKGRKIHLFSSFLLQIGVSECWAPQFEGQATGEPPGSGCCR